MGAKVRRPLLDAHSASLGMAAGASGGISGGGSVGDVRYTGEGERVIRRGRGRGGGAVSD